MWIGTENSVIARGPVTAPIFADLSHTPDLFPALAVVAACAPPGSRFSGLRPPQAQGERSSDGDGGKPRAAWRKAQGRRFGAGGRDNSRQGSGTAPRVTAAGDHRVAMAMAVAALVSGPLELDDPHCVSKSFPTFWEVWDRLLGAPGDEEPADVRIPVPAALLVEHPAVPVPRVDGAATESPPPGETVAASSLSRRERFSAALQLTAAASLLAEFDLWPGRAAIRKAPFQANFVRAARLSRAFPGTDGAGLLPSRRWSRARPRRPVRLCSRPSRTRSGSRRRRSTTSKANRGSFSRLRSHASCGSSSNHSTRAPHAPSGPFGGTGCRCPKRVLRTTGGFPCHGSRVAWAVHCGPPFGAAGAEAWLWAVGSRDEEIPPMPAISGEGTLILVGEISNDELAAVSRWTQRDGCSAVVIGRFPSGWHPPRPPGFDAQNLFRHLAVTGMPLEDARRVVEQREGRIDPLEPVDRRALTEAGRRVFTHLSGRSRATRRDANRICCGARWSSRRTASRPVSLPSTPGFRTGHRGPQAGAGNRRIRRQVAFGRGRSARTRPSASGGRGLYDAGDPRRLLHSALGSGDTC